MAPVWYTAYTGRKGSTWVPHGPIPRAHGLDCRITGIHELPVTGPATLGLFTGGFKVSSDADEWYTSFYGTDLLIILK